MLTRILKKPEYLFNPRQIPRRISYLWKEPPHEGRVTLPWGGEILVNPRETIGKSLFHFGVYDLSLSECLWRLAEPGMRVLDIGANVGYFSLLLSAKVESQGKVFSFEPHPEIFQKLKHNISKTDNCTLHNIALSNKAGDSVLFIPKDFAKNEGVASLEAQKDSECLKIRTQTLDEVFKSEKIDLIKIDVEGHELAVFEGGHRVLSETKMVLFEDFSGHKSAAINFLIQSGFIVKRIVKNFWGPSLISVADGEELPLWEPPNYIAYRKSVPVESVLSPRGWHCLCP
ncbi:MAG: FkbM family methyltransferase [Bdellovibrionales bacterium]|nr:FkbM family methyltransferase [Bdellovibrionales bacterium]